jgi:hypothetical protein
MANCFIISVPKRQRFPVGGIYHCEQVEGLVQTAKASPGTSAAAVPNKFFDLNTGKYSCQMHNTGGAASAEEGESSSEARAAQPGYQPEVREAFE